MEPEPSTEKQEFEEDAANQDNSLHQEKKRKARQANAEKQKRYRESMKAQGYRARLIWEKPLEPGLTRASAPVIQESSIGIVQNNSAIGEVLEDLCGTFIMACEKNGIAKEEWEPIYQDMRILLKPLGLKE